MGRTGTGRVRVWAGGYGGYWTALLKARRTRLLFFVCPFFLPSSGQLCRISRRTPDYFGSTPAVLRVAPRGISSCRSSSGSGLPAYIQVKCLLIHPFHRASRDSLYTFHSFSTWRPVASLNISSLYDLSFSASLSSPTVPSPYRSSIQPRKYPVVW